MRVVSVTAVVLLAVVLAAAVAAVVAAVVVLVVAKRSTVDRQRALNDVYTCGVNLHSNSARSIRASAESASCSILSRESSNSVS
jgi:NADH:ubiquinone oxidoreductase subunit 3 (subunit A)